MLKTAAPPKPLLLAITSQLPWPLNSGGHLRTFHLLRALGQRFRVRLIAPSEVGDKASMNALCERGFEVAPAWISKRGAWREGWRALSIAAGGRPYVMYARHDHQAVRKVLRQQFSDDPPDVAYLDHLDAAVYRDELPNVPVVVDFHNVYSKLARRTGDEQPGYFRRLYLRREAALLSRAEAEAAGNVDLAFAVSDRERDFFAGLGGPDVRCVPNGVDCAAYAGLPDGRLGGQPTILYVGPMSYQPNAAAADYLAKVVLPGVRAKLPEARLRIVGRDPTAAVCRLADLPGVEVVGAAPEMLPELSAAHVLAVPLQSGGGTRLKILEAFAAGLPVVSTPVGAEGLDVADGRELRITAREHFAERIVELLSNPQEGRRLATVARELVRTKYDWSIVGDIAASAVWSLWSSTSGGDACKTQEAEVAACS